MKLELAESSLLARGFKYRTHVRGYHRSSNFVPGHMRYLSDLQICVPDPRGVLNPVYVSDVVFDQLPDSEFVKVINYVAPFNSKQLMDQVISARESRQKTMQENLCDDNALTFVDSVVVEHSALNPLRPPITNFFDQKLFGIKYKYIGYALAAYLILK